MSHMPVAPYPLTAETIESVVSCLERIHPTFLEDTLLLLEEDGNGLCHIISRKSNVFTYNIDCSTGPARIVEVSLGDILSGIRCCATCVPEAFKPGGSIRYTVSTDTLYLRVALNEDITLFERTNAAVRAIWAGPSRCIPFLAYSKIRNEILLPLIRTLAERSHVHTSSTVGPLLAFTATDIKLGMSKNPDLYQLTAKVAATSLVHASPMDGVWLLHATYIDVVSASMTQPMLGTVIHPSIRRNAICQNACETFGILADDAFSRSDTWENVQQWWFTANELSR